MAKKEKKPKKEKKVKPKKPKAIKPKSPVEKQSASVYTMMLMASFIALVLGSVCLHLELEGYNYDIQAKQAQDGITRSE